MDKFEALILRSGHPAEAQKNARKELPFLLSRSNLRLWRPDDPIRADGIRFLVGIAVWSVYDMKLLDALDQALSATERSERVDVFDVNDCSTLECLENYVPQIGKIHHTPVVGLWQDGKQINQQSGPVARETIARHFGIDHKRLTTLPWIDV